MKRLLPTLTLALLGAAVTAFAADEATPTVATSSSNYYYDYYLNPPNTAPVDNNVVVDEKSYHNQSDTFTYGTRDNAGISIDNPNVFTVARESNWGNDLTFYGNKDNFYRVEFANYVEGVSDTSTVSKSSNTGKVALYLTDYVSEVVPQAAYMPTHSSSNALFNMGIVEYGYRELTANGDGTYTAGKKESYNIYKVDENGNFVTDENGNKVLSDKVTPMDSIDYFGDGRTMTRYKYELGTFDPDKIIEVYMKDADGREVYSFSSYEGVGENGENVFTPFDKTAPSEDVVSNGGFGDGGYRIAGRETDKMLYSYYFAKEINEKPNPDYEDYTKFDTKSQTSAAQKAMPLSELIPTGNIVATLGAGTAVQFGFYGVAVGSPLPGGLQIALIAGLFGLGSWYVRRRKAVAV